MPSGALSFCDVGLQKVGLASSSRSTMNANSFIPLQSRVQLLIEHAKDEAQKEERSLPRYPLFQPVSLRRGLQCLSAFSRDISEIGIGLLHDMPIGGEYIIAICDGFGVEYELAGEVLWCRPCGQGWYISGIRFCRLLRTTS